MKLREIHIKGFKSIDGREGQAIPLGDITVLLGANGAGKSNVVSALQMLNSILRSVIQNNLSDYVSRHGVNRLMFYGTKETEHISFALKFQFGDENKTAVHSIRFSYAFPDSLKITESGLSYDGRQSYFVDHGNSESGRKIDAEAIVKAVQDYLHGIRTYQFHDTSDTAKIRDRCYTDDAKCLHGDGGNLAAFLRMLKGHDPYRKYYERIVKHIQGVMPQFGDFDLESIPGAENYARLNWRDRSGSDYLFDPWQISDGALRFMALATLLLQPPDLLPKLIVLDEPELGLHPSAIAALGGFVKVAAQNTQVLVATQSTRLVDEFLPEQVVVAERDEQKRCSVFKALDAEQLREWLDRYSLSELWEKNVIGGQP